MLFLTAWHPQTDNQSKKSNKIAEIALRHFILTVPHKEWLKMLPQISAVLNNSIKYSLIYLASTEVLFSFKVKEPLDLLNGFKLDNLIEPTLELTLPNAGLSQQESAPSNTSQ